MKKDPLSKWISILYRYSMMYANEFLKEYDINAGQLPFFMNIVNKPGITQEELSRILRIDKSTTAKAIKILEDKGFIARKNHEFDKRAYKLVPTQKAKKVKKFISTKAFEWDENILLKNFNSKKKELAYEILQEMAENCLEYFKISKEKPK